MSYMSAVFVLLSLTSTTFLTVLSLVIFLASIGKSLGVGRLYIRVLLLIFDWGRQHIEKAQKIKSANDTRDDEDDVDDSEEMEKCNEKRNNHQVGNRMRLICREENLILVPGPEQSYQPNTSESHKRNFKLSDCLDYIKTGVEAIIEDEVTSRFEAEELISWNILTRTNHNYYHEFISWKLNIIWAVGFLVRYFLLLPLRVITFLFATLWLTWCSAIVGMVPNGDLKRWVNDNIIVRCFSVFSSSLSAVITYHNVENKPKCGICVANHTSPADIVILNNDNCYCMIGQRHGGILGLCQRVSSGVTPHIWFERSEVKDRNAVANKLKRHVSNVNNQPILIFPEGTCVNNTSVMQFKKGSFEVGGIIYPVAMKYDRRFSDVFWNSSKYTIFQYLLRIMTSWAIVCDVWYLPPMYPREGELSIDFANRVKHAIADQAGLVDLAWDGQLKRSQVKKEWKDKQQEAFSRRLKIE